MTQISPVTAASTVAAQAAGAAQPKAAGLSNAAIATIFEAGPRKAVNEMSVQERFATLEKRFLPNKAKGVTASFQFKLSGKGGGNWYVSIKNGKISVKKGTGPNPTVTLKASAETYRKIADGEMNKTWAFLRGKVKVEGDKDALDKFNTYFKGNSAKQ